MLTLNFITRKEVVSIFDNDSYDDFLNYVAEENSDCFHKKEFDRETEMKQFVAGLEAGGYENYSIIDEIEAKKIKEVIE